MVAGVVLLCVQTLQLEQESIQEEIRLEQEAADQELQDAKEEAEGIRAKSEQRKHELSERLEAVETVCGVPT